METRDLKQRRLFIKVVELIKHMATKTKLAVAKYIFKSIEEEIKQEGKKNDN